MRRFGNLAALTAACAAAAALMASIPLPAARAAQGTVGGDLIPLGKKAPAFTLPLAKGGTLSLENTLKTKKAVLINFWFYN